MPYDGCNRKNQLQARTNRRRRVARLYLRGLSQVEVAERIGCSQATISNDLSALRKEWLASALRDFDAAKAEELAKLDHLERVAWQAWEKSCKDAEIKHSRVETLLPRKPRRAAPESNQEEAEGARLEVVRRLTERTRKGQSGDPRFLQQIAWCIETRLKILLENRLAEVEERAATNGSLNR